MNPENIVRSQIDIIDEVGDVSLSLHYDDYDTAVQAFFDLSQKYYGEYLFGEIDLDARTFVDEFLEQLKLFRRESFQLHGISDLQH